MSEPIAAQSRSAPLEYANPTRSAEQWRYWKSLAWHVSRWLLTALYLIGILGSLLCWVLARAQLGRDPIPGRDDPYSIQGDLYSLAHGAHLFGMLWTALSILLTLAFALGGWMFVPRATRANLPRWSWPVLTSLLASLLFYLSGPDSIMKWLASD